MKIHIVFVALLLGTTSASQGAMVAQSGLTVERLLSDTQNYGGCMAKLKDYDSPAGCKSSYVTFDCDGVFSSKEAGRRSFEVAQMAYALDKPLYIAVETTETINGYCAVKRIDLYN